MKLAKVIGTVVSTRKEENIRTLKLLLLKDLDLRMDLKQSIVVAADAVGAGIGEVVLYSTGSAARQTIQTKDRPVDAVIMAIVDLVEVDGEVRYRKD
ncbi:MAG: ethanolamine utilization protein EutN [Deltaproteobacteria bacterium]|nr:ethanolamine utilization protein EutN [Deltaproteobacteria bacterium]